VGNLLSNAIASSPASVKKPHFYCSSGGNAGLACVHAALSLSATATIVVPTSTAKFMVDKIKSLGVEVVQKGAHWTEADTYLREVLLANDENGVYVPPFDHQQIWNGHESMIDEIEEQMCAHGGYDGIVCSVGGGGLFIGLMQGLEKHGRLSGGGRKEVRMLAMETDGAHSLNYSLQEGKLSRLSGITSIAGSLGATQVAPKAYEWALRPEVTSEVLVDAEAAIGCVRFADDERIMVEPACGVSVATAYNGSLRKLFSQLSDEEFKKTNVVLVVCGGSNVTLETLEHYKVRYGEHEHVQRKWRNKKDTVFIK
jgi:L-serine/L-threonine ammonia-lyase